MAAHVWRLSRARRDVRPVIRAAVTEIPAFFKRPNVFPMMIVRMVPALQGERVIRGVQSVIQAAALAIHASRIHARDPIPKAAILLAVDPEKRVSQQMSVFQRVVNVRMMGGYAPAIALVAAALTASARVRIPKDVALPVVQKVMHVCKGPNVHQHLVPATLNIKHGRVLVIVVAVCA